MLLFYFHWSSSIITISRFNLYQSAKNYHSTQKKSIPRPTIVLKMSLNVLAHLYPCLKNAFHRLWPSYFFAFLRTVNLNISLELFFWIYGTRTHVYLRETLKTDWLQCACTCTWISRNLASRICYSFFNHQLLCTLRRAFHSSKSRYSIVYLHFIDVDVKALWSRVQFL